MRSIDAKIQVVLGFEYKQSGHIVLGVGHNKTPLEGWTAIVHDPNGKRRGSSNDWISNAPTAGRLDVYSERTFNEVWRGNEGNGWGRWVKSVRGKTTGL